ncbi:membrane protein insertion efficiency factor YidD [Neorhizobium sp. NPDC001467]|uniref:membrane protein insertion efficiency factor YidD n=1 Tax=Neorhizobium sp. NPDC001467 TaxID=3390595 RepID=UPI003CFF4307
MCGVCGSGDEDDGAQRQRTGAMGRNWSGPFRKTPGRLLGMGVVRLYQLTLSGFVGNGCRHIPTCSEYGYEAFARHGFWSGFWLTLFRVGRCGPGGTAGLDPVPETLDADLPVTPPWRLWRYGQKA